MIQEDWQTLTVSEFSEEIIGEAVSAINRALAAPTGSGGRATESHLAQALLALSAEYREWMLATE